MPSSRHFVSGSTLSAFAAQDNALLSGSYHLGAAGAMGAAAEQRIVLYRGAGPLLEAGGPRAVSPGGLAQRFTCTLPKKPTRIDRARTICCLSSLLFDHVNCEKRNERKLNGYACSEGTDV